MTTITAQEFSRRPNMTITADSITIIIPKDMKTMKHKDWHRQICSRLRYVGIVDKNGKSKQKDVFTESAEAIMVQVDMDAINDDDGNFSYLIMGVFSTIGKVAVSSESIFLEYIKEEFEGAGATRFCVAQPDGSYLMGDITEVLP